jgi:hypothetical protein
MLLLMVLLVLLGTMSATAQEPVRPDQSYGDSRAQELVRLARAHRATGDTRITAYQATAHERFSAYVGVGGFERLLFRRETAARIDWSPDTVRIKLLGAREAQPVVSSDVQRPPPDIAGTVLSLAFDPTDPDILFRLDSTTIRHPLAPGSDAYYDFASGDTTSIRLPDGGVVQLLELRVTAKRLEPELINGSLWVDATTHAGVRAGFRLSRPYALNHSGISVLTPEVTGEVDYVFIDYGLWDLRWWLPRTIVARGVVRAAGTRFPLAYERTYGEYRVEGDSVSAPLSLGAGIAGATERPCRPEGFGSITMAVGAPRDSAARDSLWEAVWRRSVARVAEGDSSKAGSGRKCNRAFLVTRAEGVDLVDSPVFPGSIYDDRAGPIAETELGGLTGLLGHIPRNPWGVAPPSLQLLTPPDLLRVNRVEGLSLGTRVVLPLGPADLRGELRAGTTGEIGARLSGVRSALSLRAEVAAYRGLEAVEVASQPFSLASSASTLLLGRDENDYFRATGAELRLSPPAARRQSWDLRLFTESQEPVGARSDLSLRGLFDREFEPRGNLAAEALHQAGAILRLRGALGNDPGGLRARAELELHGETGDRTFARPLARLEADGHLWGGVGFGAALATGTGFGSVPAQRAWQIGGATTVRGHEPAAHRGESLWLARGELNYGPPLFRLSIFGDAGWAGKRDEVWDAQPLRSLGIGISLLGNLLRVDLAQRIGGGGTRLYLRIGGAP